MDKKLIDEEYLRTNNCFFLYKGWHISHDYQQQTENFDKVDRYSIWNPDYKDLVSETFKLSRVGTREFKTIEEAEQWIDEIEKNNG